MRLLLILVITGCVPPTTSDSAGKAGAPDTPGTELCNGLDDDGDGAVDEGDAADAAEWHQDLDGDGHGNAAETTRSCEDLTGWTTVDDDCDDRDAAVYPGATETCDGTDEDCDGTIDEDPVDGIQAWQDADRDGHGDPGVPVLVCEGAEGVALEGDDCDDNNALRSPDAVELCNTVDDDCDGETDESAADAYTWYSDADGDGAGSDVTEEACAAGLGWAAAGGDCDDTDPAVYPGAPERCDGVDEDCDGQVDDGASDAVRWYRDADGDGAGSDADVEDACDAPEAFVVSGGDCDDTDDAIWPGAAERCNARDDDCDGVVAAEEGDADGDGVATCAGDCDDADPSRFVGAVEACDGVDNGCTGTLGADEFDEDGDGARPCDGDCDDVDPARAPGAGLVCENGVDADCADGADCADPACDGVAACCVDDGVDEGDLPENATELTAGDTLAGTLCPGDTVDWYTTEVSGAQVSLRFEVCPTGGDVDLNLTRGGLPATSGTVADGDCGALQYFFSDYDPTALLGISPLGEDIQYTLTLTAPEEDAATECDDGVDNDDDGLLDCEDNDCSDWDNDGVDGTACGTPADPDCDDTDPDIAPIWGLEADEERCANGIDDDCDGDVDCYSSSCAAIGACATLGCDATEEEAGEPNDDGWTPVDLAWGEVVEGSLCGSSGDLADNFRLCGAAEGQTVACTLAAWDDLGRFNITVNVEDATSSTNLGATVFDHWTAGDGWSDTTSLATWQTGCLIATITPADTSDTSNTYTFTCTNDGADSHESDCADLTDSDLDGQTDCADDDCTGSTDCPCVTEGELACDATVAVEMGTGTDVYSRYACDSSGHKGPEHVYSFVAPAAGAYTFTATVLRTGGSSDDLDIYVLDAATACASGTCFGGDNADYGSPASVSLTMSEGQAVTVVLDGGESATTDMGASLAVSCPGR